MEITTIRYQFRFVQLFFFIFSVFNITAQTNTWDGSTDTDWHKTCNWSLDLIPTCAHDVVIPTVTNYPIITGTAHSLSLSITSAASNALTINSTIGGILYISSSGGSCSGTATDNGDCPLILDASGYTTFAGPNCPVTCLWVRSRSSYVVGCSGVSFRYTIFEYEDGSDQSILVQASGANYAQSIFTSVELDGQTFTSASATYTASISGMTQWQWSLPAYSVVAPDPWYMTCP